jgi:hypothetical protein
MLLDGAVALATQDYLGPELGPWAALVEALGIPPLSLGMRLFFVLHGLAWLGAAAWYARGGATSRRVLLGVALGALWYAVAGTLVALALAALLWREERRAKASPP